MQIIDEADDEATKEEEAEAQENESNAVGATAGSTDSDQSDEPYVLAVTACPTGIAHTYMARDALKNKPKKWVSKLK